MRAGVRAGEARALVPQRRLLASCEAGGLHAGCFTSSAQRGQVALARSARPDQDAASSPDAFLRRRARACACAVQGYCLRGARATVTCSPPLCLRGGGFSLPTTRWAWPTMRARRWWTSRHASARSNRAAGPARGTTPAYSRDLPPMPIAAASPANALSTGGRRARWAAEDRSAPARPATCSRPL